MLFAENLFFKWEDRIILDGVSLSLLPKQKIALVGNNGAGKSSLLKILAGTPCDQGKIVTTKNINIGLLEQIPLLANNITILAILKEALSEHINKIEHHQQLCEELSHSNEKKAKLAAMISDLTNEIEQSHGFNVMTLIAQISQRLSLPDINRKIDGLSGGEKRRVDLARLLLSSPDIYLLDEPTNHLDIAGIEYLSDFIRDLNAPVLFVSHDRSFIDDVASIIWEIDKGKIYVHKPPFANYLEAKLVRELIDESTVHKQQRLVISELAWLRRKAPARTTKQNARVDRAYQLIEQTKIDLDKQRKQEITIASAQEAYLGSTILELESLGFSYDDKNLFSNLSLKAVYKHCYGIVGKNGCGKSTLMSILAGDKEPSLGKIIRGKNLKIIKFDQNRFSLDQNATLKETLADHGDFVFIDDNKMHISSYLKRYLFSAHDAARKVKTLSGGEQNRLLLAKMLKVPGNCLLLDEPTNDLDVDTLAILEDFLLNYKGVCFVISHDRSFLDRICSDIIAFEDNNDIAIYTGNYSDYLKSKTPIKAEKKLPIKKEITEIIVKKRRSFKEEREYQAIESSIMTLEEEKNALEKELSHPSSIIPYQDLAAKAQRLLFLNNEIEKLYHRWQELEQLM